MVYRFVDCRWDIADPEAGRRLYLAGHIPGAAFLDVERDLSAPPGPGGRHPLPSAEQFAAAASRVGIGPGVFVVAYGTMGGAERLWWLLRHFGHDDTAVIDLAAWRGPLRGGEEEIEPCSSCRSRARTTRSRPKSSRRAWASWLSSTRACRSAGAASRIRSTRCLGGSPERSTLRGTNRSRNYRRASSSPTAARA